MNLKKAVISFIMLAVLGLSVAAQAFGQDSHASACASDAVTSGSFANCDHRDISSSSSDESHSPQHCHDPCHLGMSHFGHASALLNGYSIRLISLNAIESLGINVQNLVKAPDLDGPRRPPRLA